MLHVQRVHFKLTFSYPALKNVILVNLVLYKSVDRFSSWNGKVCLIMKVLEAPFGSVGSLCRKRNACRRGQNCNIIEIYLFLQFFFTLTSRPHDKLLLMIRLLCQTAGNDFLKACPPLHVSFRHIVTCQLFNFWRKLFQIILWSLRSLKCLSSILLLLWFFCTIRSLYEDLF